MEFTVLPPSFDWKLKLVHFYFKIVKMKLESSKESQLSRVLYIGLSKKLNDYNAPMA
jgi:hypothetical protein